MSVRHLLFVVVLIMPALPLSSAAGPCDAYFPFDDDLLDGSGNRYEGKMIGMDDAPIRPKFVSGKIGRALQLDGTGAMRAFIDLHMETCPQISFTAWIQVESTEAKGAQSLFSTGSGNGPGLTIYGRSVALSGAGSGLIQRDALRDKNEWFFVAGVYDYSTRNYRLHWRNRSMAGMLREKSRPPEDAIWIGAFNDRLTNRVLGAYVDDLRIYGRALTEDEVRRIQAENAPYLRPCLCGPKEWPAASVPDAEPAAQVATYQICGAAGDCRVEGDACFDISMPADGTAGSMCTHGCKDDSQCGAANGFTGACYSLAGASSVCYQRCDSDSDCGQGNACKTVTQPSGLLDAVCTPTVSGLATPDGSGLQAKGGFDSIPRSEILLPGSQPALTMDTDSRLPDERAGAESGSAADVMYALCEAADDCGSAAASCYAVDIPERNVSGALCTLTCDGDSQCPAANGFTGACYSLGGAASVCYQRCDMDTDCSAETTCVSLTLPTGLTDGFCLPGKVR